MPNVIPPGAGSADGFEDLLAEAASTLANSPGDQIDQTLTSSLRQFAEFFGFDRGMLLTLSTDACGLHVSHAWRREGLPAISAKASIDSQLPWYAAQMRSGRIVAITHMSTLPAEAVRERDFVLSTGIKSHIGIPLLAEERVLGAIAFACVDQERHWPRSLVVRLRLVGAVIAMGLQRHRYHDDLAAMGQAMHWRDRHQIQWEARRAEQLRRLASHLINVEYHQRRRLGEALHEDIMQLLAATVWKLSPAHSASQNQAAISEAIEMLQETIGKLRKLTADLRPLSNLAEGVVGAIQWLANQATELHCIAVEVRAGNDVDPVSDDVRLFLYQSAQELLDNVAVHADTHRAVVGLRRTDSSHLQLTVTDAGKGFDTSRLKDIPSQEFGLFSIYERAELMGGRFEISSTIGGGTVATLIIPTSRD
ncbi:MAG: GAF domain-containing protein [Planctomycetaceae bacterium]|nr:GAF domain-containing protein [Planctomycetaceae bacterium]